MRVGFITRVVWIALLSAGFCSMVSAATPTEEQLRFLQQLSPEEREALLNVLQNQRGGQTQDQIEFPELVTPVDDEEDAGAEEEDEREKPVIEAGDTVVVELILKEEAEVRRAQAARGDDPDLERLLGRHLFDLNEQGVLSWRGVNEISLAGLTAEEAAVRLSAEPTLSDFDIILTRLPLKRVEELARFGYDLFEGVPSTFAPATDIPVPANYVMGPGDTVMVQLYGSENIEHSLVVQRDGSLSFPAIGPVHVAGLRFQELKQELQRRISEQMIGVSVSITLGELRSIRVFVMGDAEQPGSYTVSGLSTVSNALFASGGAKPVGSLRNIQLKRNGKVVGRLDLYDMLLRGDTSDDVRLLPGDVIFIPPVGPTVGVDGEIKRPAVYELRGERKVAEMIKLAGGLLPSAFPQASQLERINENRQRTLVDLDLTQPPGLSAPVRDGDLIRVFAVPEKVNDTVTLSGHVYRSGEFQWRAGMRLTDLIPSASLLRPRADLNYVLVRRELPPDYRLDVLAPDLTAALAAPGSEPDLPLMRRDELFVFDFESDRGDKLEPLLEELRLQATAGSPAREVGVGGQVKAPGRYPLVAGMRVSDLIRAGGGLREAAFTLDAELTRNAVVGEGEYRETGHIPIELPQVLAGAADADFPLEAYDFLNIREIPQWQEQEEIEILGEVRFPGTYPVQRGETLSSAVARAGGITDLAFPEGSIFLREDLRRRELEQLQELIARVESDIVALPQDEVEAKSTGQSLLRQLKGTRASGRLVIDLRKILAGRAGYEDIVVKDKDRLLVPKRTQEVTLIGEVQYSTSHIYEPGLSRKDYIERSGGMTANADKKRVYIVRANGAVVADARSGWFRKGRGGRIRPGDTIVVPLDADRVSPIKFWTSVTQILYNVGIATAAVSSL